jgi:nicotinamidase-related amidase
MSRAQRSRTGVLVIDMLEDFFGAGTLPAVPERPALVNATVLLLDGARSRGAPVLYACDRYAPAEAAIDHECRAFGVHCVDGTQGAQIIPELTPQADDLVLEKKRFDAFFASPLELVLNELDLQRIVLAGVTTDVCIRHTAAGAFFRGIAVAVASDCCGAVRREDHDASLEYMKTWYGAAVDSSARMVASL